jgi:hypothetical protein
MTIEKYIEEVDEGFCLEEEYELNFVDRDNSNELIENIEWALNNSPEFESIATVLRSYYNGTIVEAVN